MDERPSYLVDIDRLVLDGFDLTPGQAKRLRGLVTAELQRLLSEEQGPTAPGHTDRVVAAPVQWQPAHGERALAAGLAQRLAQAATGTGQQGE